MDSGQSLLLSNLLRYFTHRDSISLFLGLTAVVAILFVVFGQSTQVLHSTSQSTALSAIAQVAIATLSGFAFLLVSRVLLYLVSRRGKFQFSGVAIWLAVELIGGVAILTLIVWALSGGGKVSLPPLVGDILLYIIAIEVVPYVVSFLYFLLCEERAEVANLRMQLTKLAVDDSNGAGIINFYDKGKRLAFATQNDNILYIEAADNYANIHYINEGKEDCFILHNSMKEIEKNYSSRGLLRCHRGYMVNAANVKMLRKENSMLMLELKQIAKSIPVSKTYEENVMKCFEDSDQ